MAAPERGAPAAPLPAPVPALLPDNALYLRRAITLAEQAVAGGGRPFGALVVRADGRTVAEAGAVASLDRRDWTAHSEMQALRLASATLRWDELADCTLYASAEPCAMCASAAYWCNLSRVVYGVSAERLDSLRQPFQRAQGIAIGARELLARCPRAIEVVGPLLEDDGMAVHMRFWPTASAGV